MIYLFFQKRFQYENISQEAESTWWVPLSYTNQEEADFTTTKPSHWLKAQGHITIDNLNTHSNHWVVFNINETGILSCFSCLSYSDLVNFIFMYLLIFLQVSLELIMIQRIGIC